MDGANIVAALDVFAIQQFAHRLPAGGVRFVGVLAFVGVHAAFRCRRGVFGSAALRAAIGEAGFVRFQLEFFFANRANFDGESHLHFMIRRSNRSMEVGYSPVNVICKHGRKVAKDWWELEFQSLKVFAKGLA
jgi:hypothetical protein